jgi:ubiquinone/menaquinone biosynthesis C-methylase UbiE
MLLRFLHWAASSGWVYDRIQIASGAREVYRRLARRLPDSNPEAYSLDVGGGTGGLRQAWRARCRYLCLDLEAPKLRTLLAKHPGSLALLADAARMPLADASVDAIVCTAVAHHIPPETLDVVFAECARVLRPEGRFVFLDALRRPDRWLSRRLWSVDRGAHPHDAETLRSLLGEHFDIEAEERFAILHDYLLLALRKRAAVR